jgi:hypothetical protein
LAGKGVVLLISMVILPRIDHRAVDVGENFEVPADADVIAVAGNAERDRAGAISLLGEGFDLDELLDLPVGEQAHGADPPGQESVDVVRCDHFRSGAKKAIERLPRRAT